jgi:hypothetical protein
VRKLPSIVAASFMAGALVLPTAAPAFADAGTPGQSMTHIKTIPGVAPALESAGVVLYNCKGYICAISTKRL